MLAIYRLSKTRAFKIYGAEPCSDCTVAPSKVINEWVDESGNEVKMFEENVEVIYLENDAIIPSLTV